MDGEIAWTRFSIYVGTSILLVSEFYRLMLFVSQIIIYAPVLFAFLQNFVQWGFLIGFSLLFIGFSRFRPSNPTIKGLTIAQPKLTVITRLTGILVISTIFLSLLPPVSLTVSGSLYIIYLIFLSIFWTAFYVILLFWVRSYWNLLNDPLSTETIPKNKLKWIHVLLIGVISAFWLFESLSLIFLSAALFSNIVINGLYVILFLCFIVFQIWFYIKVRNFALRIIG